jgi:hypothetical protein
MSNETKAMIDQLTRRLQDMKLYLDALEELAEEYGVEFK